MKRRRGLVWPQLEDEQLRLWRICRLAGHRPSSKIVAGHHVCRRCRSLYR